MAYVDLQSTNVIPISGGAQYNFSYDTPISQDGSPHLTHIGFQIDWTLVTDLGVPIPSTIGRLIQNMRIKIGSETILNFDDPYVNTDGVSPSNISCLAQKVGGVDASTQFTLKDGIGELTLPFGIDATRSHRVNFAITLGDEEVWCGSKFDTSTTEFNVVNYYGVAAQATLYGSRQDFLLSTGAERTITTYGKVGWEMLGVVAINGADDKDNITQIRVNNGAFRALTVQQWRVLDSSYQLGIRAEGAGDGNTGGVNTPLWVTARLGFSFLDLKRLTAGANIDMTVTSDAAVTYSFFPVWVANIGAGTSKAPRQNQKSVSSTAYNVEQQSGF